MKTGNHSVHTEDAPRLSRVASAAGLFLAGTAVCGLVSWQGTGGLDLLAAEAAPGGTPQEPVAAQEPGISATLAYGQAQDASEKDETVYVFTKADGSTKSTEVSSQLKNEDEGATLRDQSILTDIENTEGDEEYSSNADGLVWGAEGKDIYYKGKTTKSAPVSIKVTYWLDGQKISADELAGKSGKVKIRYEYTNNSSTMKTVNGADTKIYTPFLCITGMVLDNDGFKNVEVKNGKAINDGDRTIAVGYTMPGMKDNLDIDFGDAADLDFDLDLPNYIEVTADVQDFDLNQTLTLVTSDLFSDAEKGSFDTSKLGDSLNELSDAMGQIIDGGGKLTDGLDKLADGSEALADGTGKLADGASSLQDGVGALDKGAKSLSKGLGDASKGSGQLSAGTADLVKALQLFKNGNSEQTGLKDAVSSVKVMIDGVGQLSDGVAGLVKITDEVKDNKESITRAIKQLKAQEKLLAALSDELNNIKDVDASTLQQAAGELESIKSKLAKAQESLAKVKDILGTVEQLQSGALEKKLGDLASGLGQASSTLSGQAANADSGKDDAAAAAQEAGAAAQNLGGINTDGLSKEDKQTVSDAQSALGQAATQLGEDAKTMGTDAAVMSGVADKLDKIPSELSSVAGMLYSVKDIDLEDLKDALAKVESALTEDKVKTIIDSINSFESQLASTSIDDINTDLGVLKKYTSALSQIVKSKTADQMVEDMDNTLDDIQKLADGLKALQSGLKVMKDGGTVPDGRSTAGLEGAVAALGDTKTEGTLINGASQLNTGSEKLAEGLKAADTGAGKLAAGTSKLNKAAPGLVEGVNALDDGANQIAEGNKTAAEGAHTLLDGLNQFNDEGIQKLVSMYNDNIAGLGDRFDAIIDAGNEYDNFSGKSEGAKRQRQVRVRNRRYKRRR